MRITKWPVVDRILIDILILIVVVVYTYVLDYLVNLGVDRNLYLSWIFTFLLIFGVIIIFRYKRINVDSLKGINLVKNLVAILIVVPFLVVAFAFGLYGLGMMFSGEGSGSEGGLVFGVAIFSFFFLQKYFDRYLIKKTFY